MFLVAPPLEDNRKPDDDADRKDNSRIRISLPLHPPLSPFPLSPAPPAPWRPPPSASAPRPAGSPPPSGSPSPAPARRRSAPVGTETLNGKQELRGLRADAPHLDQLLAGGADLDVLLPAVELPHHGVDVLLPERPPAGFGRRQLRGKRR